MRLNHFDLNLLVALDALLSEQSTTRAGKRLNLSQPAMSCALARLRSYFNDSLLTQVGRNLVPTPLGASLVQPVRELLLRTEATLDSRPIFDPATARRTFKVLMSDYVSTVLMAEVTTRAEHIAPSLSFEILPLGLNSINDIESGDVEEHYVCVAWAGNTLVGDSITCEQYLSLGHVVARPGAHPQRHPAVDELFFQRQGLERRVETVVGEFSVLPQYVVGSMRIATMHNRLAELYAGYMPLKILPLPYDLPILREAVAWNRHRDQDLGLAWVRNLLKTTAEHLVPSSRSKRGAQLERVPSTRVRHRTRAAI
jgi:LysR family nod box-dependent transcriptional activator